jgi:putative ABC transport system ATP-binding protein
MDQLRHDKEHREKVDEPEHRKESGVISIHGLSHRYGESEVLRLPEWTVAPGERWLVHGPSGCGKTTLLHVIAGLVRPSTGSVKVAGADLQALRGSTLDRWRGATVGIVLQAMHLISHLSVLDNMRLAQYLARVSQDDARVGETLAALGVADKAARRPGALSQGEQQRVAIARAVLNGPKLLLADEPAASLDDGAAARAVELLFTQAQRHRATLVVATHDGRVKQHFEKRLELAA